MKKIFDIAKDSEQSWGTLADAIDRNFDEASTEIQTIVQSSKLFDDELVQVRSDLSQELKELEVLIKPFSSNETISTNNRLSKTVYVGNSQKNFVANVSVVSGGEGQNGFTIFGGTIEEHTKNNLGSSSFGYEYKITLPEDCNTVTFFTQYFTVETKLQLSLKALDSLYYKEKILEEQVENNTLNIEENSNEIKKINDIIFPDGLAGVTNTEECLKNGILSIWTDKYGNSEDLEEPVIHNLRNAINTYGVIFQIAKRSALSNAYYTYTIKDPVSKKIGTEVLELDNSTMQRKIFVEIDWDKVPEISPFGRLSNKPVITWDELNKSKSTSLNEKIVEIDKTVSNNTKEIEQLKKNQWDTGEMPINVFGDVVPESFLKKLRDSTDDVEIVCVGNSLTGLIGTCTPFTDEEASHLPAGMTYKHWTYKLWNSLSKNKPQFDRIDSIRDEINVFTTVGDFTKISNGKLNEPTWSGEYSVSADTYQSNNDNAQISFEWDLSEFSKCNIVFSMSAVDGAMTQIEIAQGNGLVLASLDKSEWVEANGYVVNQNCNPEGYTESQAKYTHGVTFHQRHRKIWLKAVEGKTDTISVTYKKSEADSSKYMYFWGIERWNQSTVYLTNIGRSGRAMELLSQNSSDIRDRNPDLVMYEIPLANETNKNQYGLEALKGWYQKGFFSDDEYSYKTYSEDFTKYPLLIILPHGRANYYIGNDITDFNAQGSKNDMFNYLKCKAIYQYVIDNLKQYENVGFVNLMDTVINDGFRRKLTIQAWLTGSENNSTMTADGIHLNDLGSDIWWKYLYPLFQV